GGEGAVARDDALLAIRAGLLCNDAQLRQGADGWAVHGDPMEGALVVLAAKAGLEPEAERRRSPRLDAVPFDAQHRFMAVLQPRPEDPASGTDIFIKGAPERVLEMCASERHEGRARPIDRAAWHRAADRLAASGQRVLALALLPAGAERD